MNDKEHRAQKARIQALIKKWHAVLGLRWWRVTHAYTDTVEGMPDSARGTTNKTLAVCEVEWPYMAATVTWNLENVKDCDDDYLEEAFIHECVHILVNEMRFDKDGDLSHEERVATTLAKAFLSVRDHPPKAGA